VGGEVGAGVLESGADLIFSFTTALAMMCRSTPATA
jgi:hypothetical protein